MISGWFRGIIADQIANSIANPSLHITTCWLWLQMQTLRGNNAECRDFVHISRRSRTRSDSSWMRLQAQNRLSPSFRLSERLGGSRKFYSSGTKSGEFVCLYHRSRFHRFFSEMRTQTSIFLLRNVRWEGILAYVGTKSTRGGDIWTANRSVLSGAFVLSRRRSEVLLYTRRRIVAESTAARVQYSQRIHSS